MTTAEPDIIYMHERLNFIGDSINEAYSLYVFLNELDNVSEAQYKRLHDLYEPINPAIRDYYIYLEKVNVNPKDSYLTAMLEKQDYADKLEDIYWFLESTQTLPESK